MDSDPPRWEFQRFSCLLAGALCPVISRRRFCCGFLPEEGSWLTVTSTSSTPQFLLRVCGAAPRPQTRWRPLPLTAGLEPGGKPSWHRGTLLITAIVMMAPLKISIRGVDVVVTAQPLEASAFAPFGEVIQNPRPGLHPSNFAAAGPLPLAAVSANQGSAIKYQHVTRMVNTYDQAPSGKPGVAVMNMFVCAARKLGTSQSTSTSHSTTPSSRIFEVGILERHPYTTQTFTPLSTSGPASPQLSQHGYLVIVAPGLQTPSGSSAGRIPSHTEATAQTARGIHYNSQAQSQPDLQRLKAFVATTNQAVTYGAGVWHAPMVALGPEGSTVDYVVTQFANGVGIEDCEEVVMESPENNGHILVELPALSSSKASRL